MAGLYSPESLGIKPPSGGFQQGGWYSGRQYWDGTLSDPGVINPKSNQQGAGQAVSAEVNAQSAAAQGVSAQQLESYLQAERDKQAKMNVAPVANINPNGGGGNVGTFDKNSIYGTGGLTPVPSIDLPGLYKSLYESEGVSALEKQLTDKQAAYNTAKSKINDNPFLSEGERTGRVAKLTDDYNANIKNDQDALAMKKQDIATQLDIQTKQFDINSQVAQQALQQFNVLLSSGALAGATGDDIASITRSTGISSSMIQAAIKSQTEKDTPTSVTTVDDGTNQYAVVLNTKTGQVISKQVLAASKPAATTQSDKSSYYQNALRQDAANGLTLSQIFSIYTGYLDPNLIYQLYNANSKYGPDKGNVSALSKYGVTDPSKLSASDQLLQKIAGQ